MAIYLYINDRDPNPRKAERFYEEDVVLPFITFFVDKFVNYFKFMIDLLSIYRFFLHLLLCTLIAIDLTVLTILQFIVHICFRIAFYFDKYK